MFGASLQRRGGVARHDAVAWGYARGADARGVDIIQNCEVTGFDIEGGKVVGVETTRGSIRAEEGRRGGRRPLRRAGRHGRLPPADREPPAAGDGVGADQAGARHASSCPAQVHVYVSQSDKGELVFGAGIDSFNSYAQRGSPPVVENMLNALIELFPIFSRLRFLRQWGGIVDTCPDASPIIGKTPVENLFFNCGWGTGGFKATPGSGCVFAHTIATGEPHKLDGAVRARALHHRLPDRRARRRRRRSLTRHHPMLLIPCPYCGKRDEHEFTYAREGHIARPDQRPSS